jgi:hypothetical protein
MKINLVSARSKEFLVNVESSDWARTSSGNCVRCCDFTVIRRAYPREVREFKAERNYIREANSRNYVRAAN